MTDYRSQLTPVFDEIIECFELMADKHGDGIFFKDDDLPAAISHGVAALRGKPNPDGVPHEVAMLVRGCKVRLRDLSES